MKKLLVLCTVLCSFVISPAFCNESEVQNLAEHNKTLIKSLFKEMYENPNLDLEKFVPQHFSKNYIQYVDGKVMKYGSIIKHRLAQKEILTSIKIKIEHIVAEGDKVFTIHRAYATKKDGSKVQAKIIALFQIKDDKVVLCDELTRTEKGTKEDQDLGSRE